MDIEARIRLAMTDGDIKSLVRDVLKEVADSGHDLGGMGEYGRGWNDRGEQIRIFIKEMIGRWNNESKNHS